MDMSMRYVCVVVVLSLISFLIGVSSFQSSRLVISPRSSPTLSMALFDKISGKDLKIAAPDGSLISYDYFAPEGGTVGTPIVYLPGLVRQKNEAKSINLRALCKKNSLTYLGADYHGVGRWVRKLK